MDKKEAEKRIDKLKETINYHRYLYHVLDKEEISEAALDSLKHELCCLEQDHPDLVTKDSPTQRVEGRPLDKFVKIKHKHRMLSLNDVFNFEELSAWEKRIYKAEPKLEGGYFAEIKMDGLAISLIYRNGELWKGATRGDGLVGEEVTLNIKTIEDIPLRLRLDELDEREKLMVLGEIEVRGEVYINIKDLEKINIKQKKLGLAQFANPRNLAAGSIRQLNPAIAAKRKLRFMSYDMISSLGQKTHQEIHNYLLKMGFPTNKHNRFCENLSEVQNYFEYIGEIRKDLPYQIDGVVVAVNNLKYYEKLGVVGKAPRYMSAYKFPAEQSTSKIVDIEVQVGRTGVLTPVAILEPVNVAGSVVSRATLHNQDEINRKDIRIGDTVIVQKAGDVIPEIVQSIESMRTGEEKIFRMPASCPICGSDVEKIEGEVASRCTNKKCFAQVRRGIRHFVSKGAFDIVGLGPKIIDKLIDEGLINDMADIFSLKKGDLELLERFAERSAENLMWSIQQHKKIEFARLIYALGIRHVGQQTAHDLAMNYKNINDLMNADWESLNKIENIGETVAKSIEEYFGDEKNRHLIARLFEAGVEIVQREVVNKLENMVFVVTGSMDNFSREEIQSMIRENGGKVASGISKNVNWVICGENPGSKIAKAKELGVEIVSEQDFIKMIK